MEMDLEQSTSSVGGELTVKQEPVELKPLIIPKQEIEYITVEVEPLVKAEEHLPLKQEIEYISVKEEPPCLEKWEPDSSQDPLSITKEECSPPEYYLGPSTSSVSKTEISTSSASKTEISTSSASKTEISTSSVSKTEIEEDEGEDAGGDDWEEVKHEVEPTSDDSEPESVILAGEGVNKGTDDDHSLVTIEEPYCGNECAAIYQGYCCSICKKTFAQFQDLKQHRKVSGHETLHSCSASDKTFTSNKKMMVYSHPHNDERSCKKFTRDNVLKLLRVHVGEPQYSCDVCRKRFKLMSHLKVHLCETKDSCVSKCDACGMLFRNDCAFRKHLKEHTEQHYSCVICRKTFKNNNMLMRHTQTQHGYQAYKTFKQKSDLQQRSQKLNDNEPYVCNVCNRICGSRGGLKKHSKIHPGKNNPERTDQGV